MSRLINKWNDGIRNQAISIIRNLTTENGLSFDELGVLSSFLLIERIENSKLAHYEDLEEKGRLIELPCAVGDEVFIIWGPRYRAGRSVYGINTGKFRLSDIQNLNNTVFTTREAAEAKLAEMEDTE